MPIPRNKMLEAVEEARKRATDRGFTQSFDLSIGIKDVDLSNPENRIDLEVKLPHGTGKSQKVAVFAEGELAEKARRSGADQVINRKEIKELSENKQKAKGFVKKFGYFIAKADMMPFIGKELGPILGPRGKMPQPIPPTADPGDLIERLRSTVRIRVRTDPVAHVLVGREDMSDRQISENIETILETIESNLPKGPKQVKSVYLKTTMGKPVQIEV